MDLGRIYDEAIFRDKMKIGKNSILDEYTENNQVNIDPLIQGIERSCLWEYH